MQERHDYHRQVDWIALDREAKRRAREAAQESIHGPVVKPDRRSPLKVPPLNRNYYSGEHLRAEREKYSRRLNAENDARAAAVRRRQAALRYAAETKQKLRERPSGGQRGGQRIVARPAPVPAPVPARSPSPKPKLIRRLSGPEDTTADKTFPHTKAGLFPAVRLNQGLDVVKAKSPGRPTVVAADASQVRMLATQATQLNHRMSNLERNAQASSAQLRGSMQRGEDGAPCQPGTEGAEARWSNAFRTNADLCSTYVEAIATKLKLLEALRAA